MMNNVDKNIEMVAYADSNERNAKHKNGKINFTHVGSNHLSQHCGIENITTLQS